jgi:ribosomal protein S18 acetylase RimI-like enzyme
MNTGPPCKQPWPHSLTRGPALVVFVQTVPEWTIRSVIEQDIEPVLCPWDAAGSLPSVTDTREGLLRLLATDTQALLIAEEAGAAIESLIAAWMGGEAASTDSQCIVIARRQGIAAALLRDGERRLRARGAVRLTAIVAENDLTAMGFWRAAGYRKQSDRARFVHIVED